MGRYEAAVDLAREAIHESPASPDAYLTLALALDHLGRHAEAAEGYRVVVSLAEDPYRALLLLGRSLARAGEVARAVEVFASAHALRPDDARRYPALGSGASVPKTAPRSSAYCATVPTLGMGVGGSSVRPPSAATFSAVARASGTRK